MTLIAQLSFHTHSPSSLTLTLTSLYKTCSMSKSIDDDDIASLVDTHISCRLSVDYDEAFDDMATSKHSHSLAVAHRECQSQTSATARL